MTDIFNTLIWSRQEFLPLLSIFRKVIIVLHLILNLALGKEKHEDLPIFFQTKYDHELYLNVSRKVTTQHDARCLGIHLGCHPDDVSYVVNNYDVREAAYRFLSWMDDNYGSEYKWEMLVRALTALDKKNSILELGLHEKLTSVTRVKWLPGKF